MGKLVLTRKAGESVIVTEPNGATWRLKLEAMAGPSLLSWLIDYNVVLITKDGQSREFKLRMGESLTFAGGSVELRHHRRNGQLAMAFDHPRDVEIWREELV